MKIFNKFLPVLCMSLTMLACTKEVVEPVINTQKSQDCEFLTYNVGNNFVMNSENGLITTDVVAKVNLNNMEWLQFVTNEDTSYARCDGEFWLQMAPSLPGFVLRAVKVNPNVNDTWTDVLQTNGQTLKYKKTVTAVDVSRVVEGNTYTDVTEIAIEASTEFEGTDIVFAEYNEYYSKTAGFLESTLDGGERTLVSRTY